MLKNAFVNISNSSSEQTSLHFSSYSFERLSISDILPHGNSPHWLHFSTLCALVHSTNRYVHSLCDAHPEQAISSFETIVSRQPILNHNSAVFFSSSPLCALYRGHSRQLSPHKVIFSFMVFFFQNYISYFVYADFLLKAAALSCFLFPCDEGKENEFCYQLPLSSEAVLINSVNSGCGRFGRDLNSGWNCTATKNG